MRLISVPLKLLIRLVVLPVKVVLATAGLTFRAGFKAGTLPVKGSAFAVRSFGIKAVVLFAAGLALGVYVGRRLGSTGVELAEASYPGDFGSSVDRVAAAPAVVAEVAEAVADAEEEAEAELEAAIDSALGVTGGELGVDTADVDEAG
jgi:hypothetical protein